MRFFVIIAAVVVLPLCIALATKGGEESSDHTIAQQPSDRPQAEPPQENQAVVPAVPLNPYVPSFTPAAPAPGVYPPPGDVIYGAGPYSTALHDDPAPIELRDSNKTVSEKGTVPFFLADSEKLGQSPTVLLESLNVPPVKYVSLWPDSLPGGDGKPIEKPTSKFGAKLFSHVTSVSFAGPAFPVNSDGTLEVLAASENGTIAIYEHYIVSEEPTDDGGVHRTVYPYDKLGKFEQVIRP